MAIEESSESMTLEESTREMAKLYESGMSLKEVGNRFGITGQGVRDRFARAGIVYRKSIPKEITLEMARLYETGMTLEEVGRHFGMTRQGVRDRFVKAGIARRKPVPIDKARLEALYIQDRLPIPKIAAIFGVNSERIEYVLKTYNIATRPPLKEKSGYISDFLRSLSLGETGIFKLRTNAKYAHIHHRAKLVGIKVSTKSCGNNEFKVTRLR